MKRHTVIVRLSALLAAAAWVMLPAAMAIAAEDAGHGSPWMDILYKSVNVAVLVGILVYFLRKPAAGFFRKAAQDEKNALDDVRKDERVTAQAVDDQRREIEKLHEEVERMREEARADAAAELNLMTQEANLLADKLKAQSRQQIEQEMRKARLELRTQLADETIRLAEDLIKQRVDPDIQKALVREYTDKLGARS